MNTLKYLVAFAFTIAFVPVLAQGENPNSLKGVPASQRIVTGGGFGLSFGTNQDFVSVSPVLGYMVNRKFMVGTSVTYRFTNFKIVSPSIKLHDYGVSPFARYTVYKNIFLQAEYEYLNYEFPVDADNTIRKGFNSALAGGGLIQPIGQKAAFFIVALYNFSYKASDALNYSPYDSPLVIRAGINVGGFLF